MGWTAYLTIVEIYEAAAVSHLMGGFKSVKGNGRRQHEDIYCTSCSINIEETQFHLLNYKYLLGKNENLSYIPDHKELFQGDINKQIYVARLLKEN